MDPSSRRTTRRTTASSVAPMLWLACVAAAPADAGPFTEPVIAPSCAVAAVGSPACAIGSAPGSTVDPAGPAIHRGNPVEVPSGNKYQRETDYLGFGTGLAFVRHYNSLPGDEDLGLGHGWRHTYQVTLGAVRGGGLRIVQSDGRGIDFTAVPGTSEPMVHRASSEADGLIVREADLASWHLPDGRRLDFLGRWLVRIDFGDARGALDVEYSGPRVARVRDRLGRTLVLHYVPASESLPAWGTNEAYRPPGALEAVTLPDGGQVRFVQDTHRQLVSASYPDGSSVAYEHDAADWRSGRLTSRRAMSGESGRVDETRWRYDGDGLAIGMSGSREMSIERTSAGPHAGVATVRWGDGRTESVTWPRVPEGAAVDRPPAPTRRRAGDDETTKLLVAVDAAIAALQTVEGDAHTLVTTLPLEHGSAALWMRADRHGNLQPTWLGATNLESVLARSAVGDLPACDGSGHGATAIDLFGVPPERLRHLPIVARLGELAAGAAPCADDVVVAFALQDALKRRATARDPSSDIVVEPALRIAPPDFAPRRGRRPGARPSRVIVPEVQGPEPDPCDMPPGKDCTALTEDHEMAVLSECAYESVPCRSAWREVPPGEIGLEETDFHLDGFDAVLYHDPATDRYTVAFRGTDDEGDDWTANFDQGRGRETRQYSLAYELAGEVEGALPAKTLTFTGHSLGGGMATFAALRTRREATVFNPASLHSKTAAREGLEQEYADANNYIDLVTVHDDPVTAAMRLAHNNGSFGLQFSPGRHTVLANPDPLWIDTNFDGGGTIDDRLARHSIATVIEQLEILLVKHCGATF